MLPVAHVSHNFELQEPWLTQLFCGLETPVPTPKDLCKDYIG